MLATLALNELINFYPPLNGLLMIPGGIEKLINSLNSFNIWNQTWFGFYAKFDKAEAAVLRCSSK